MSERPLIGIVYSDCAMRDNDMRIRTYVSKKYSNAVLLSGGDPILLPVPFYKGITKDEIIRLVERYLGLIDGILLAGGEDVHPKYQGEDPVRELGGVNPYRDEFEIVLAQKVCKDHRMPILGICRGIQVLAIALGGKVYQDISGIASVQHSQNSPRWATSHYVYLTSDTELYKIANVDKVMVNSFHHQAVKTVPYGFSTVAKTSDGIIEAMEYSDANRFCLGIQWHPEETIESDDFSKNIFKTFVDKCKK